MTDTFRQIFGKKIKFLRKQKGMTQVELSKLLGYVSTGAISQIENGVKGMEHEKIILAAEIFGVHPSVLMSPVPMDDDKLETMMMFAKLINDGNSEYLQAIRDLISVAHSKLSK